MFLKPEELLARRSKSSRATKRKEVSTVQSRHAAFHLPSCKVHTKKIEGSVVEHYNWALLPTSAWVLWFEASHKSFQQLIRCALARGFGSYVPPGGADSYMQVSSDFHLQNPKFFLAAKRPKLPNWAVHIMLTCALAFQTFNLSLMGWN